MKMKNLTTLPALFVVLSALPVLAQQPSAGASQQIAKKAPAAPSLKPQGLTVDGVISMAKAGLSEDIILTKIRKEGKAFDLSTDDMIHLKEAKVSDAVLKVMMDPKAEIATATAAQAPQAVAAPAPQPVVVQSPIVAGIATVAASGATPAPGANATGDPNDPLSPHDSGIYVYTKDRDGKAQMIVLERAGYQGSKTGGLLTSALTYGIKKAKTKAVIPGPTASIRVSEASPVFYFYFDDKQVGLGKTNFGIGSLSNPNQFALLKLEVNKANRETVIGQFSALGMSSGSDANAMIPFKSERMRPGLYKVVVAGLQLGEYCFLASNNQGGAYAAGATAAADIFDFGVSVEGEQK
jgi:hypothetical protein